MPLIALNNSQERVLRWVAEGSPDGVMEGYGYRLSASALRSRGLVTIRGRGPTWSATLTDAGRTFLAAPPATGPTERGGLRASGVGPRTGSSAKTAIRGGPLKTEQLVADVVAAGGTLVVPESAPDGGNYRQRAYAAQRFGKVPEGKHLEARVVRGGYEITLRDGGTGNEQGAAEVPVPARIARYHRVAAAYAKRLDLQQVSRAALGRAKRIIHALATEADARGHAIECSPVRGRQELRRGGVGHLKITIDGHENELRLAEIGVGNRGLWEAEKQSSRDARLRYPLAAAGNLPPIYDEAASGRLELSIVGRGYAGRKARWGDRQRWTLEDRLPQALRELESLAAEAVQREIERERAAVEEERRWREAMVQAEEEFRRSRERALLLEHASAWQQAETIRRYADALRAAQSSDASASPDAATQHWLDLADEHARAVPEIPRLDDLPAPRPDELAPFLRGMSPYGPRDRPYR